MEEAKNQINDLEHKEEKDIQLVQQEGKKIQKIKDNIRSLGQLQAFQHLHERGCQKEKRRSKKLEIYLKK